MTDSLIINSILAKDFWTSFAAQMRDVDSVFHPTRLGIIEHRGFLAWNLKPVSSLIYTSCPQVSKLFTCKTTLRSLLSLSSITYN